MTASPVTLSRFATHDASAYPELWRGCVGAWAPCLGPSGARLHDYSRRMAWGDLTNMDPATDWVVRSGGYILDFDGANDYVRTTSTYSPGTGPMSVSLWVDGKATNQYGFFVGNRSAAFNSSVNSTWSIGYGNYNIGPANTGRIGALWYSPSNYRVLFSDDAFVDKLYHLCLVATGSTLLLHIDGRQVSSAVTAVNAYPNITNADRIGIGATENSLFTSVYLDDIRIYDRALHPEEIRLLARYRGIAYTPSRRVLYGGEDAGGVTSRPWLYRRSTRMIGA